MDILLGAQSQEVTSWPQRLALTAAVLAVIVLSIWAMWRSWRRRAAMDLPLREEPADYAPDLVVSGRYVGTAPASDWMQRVVASGVGAPGVATAGVAATGIRLERVGEPSIFIAADQIRDVALGRGVAGQVAEKDGLVLWWWAAGDSALQTGFRPDAAEDVASLYTRSRELFAGEENR
jgi:hypothetical protein